jgi:hypothetical protein
MLAGYSLCKQNEHYEHYEHIAQVRKLFPMMDGGEIFGGYYM